MNVKSSIKEFIYPPKTVTNSCHASTVLPLSDGSVVAAWFGGSAEGNNDVKIWVSIRENGKWSQPCSVSVDGEPLPHWNPVLFLRENGEIILYFKYGKPIPNWVTYFCVSKDGGKSFSKPQILVPGDNDGGRGPVKNKAIRLKSGRIIAPSSTEQNKDWRCFVDISDNDMKTWEKTDFVERPKRYGKTVGMIQPTLWESEPDNVHMLVRTNRRYIYRSDSADGGKTWCPAYKTGLFNNNSGIDIAKTHDGRLFLVSNPVKENWGERTPLTVVCSADNGNSWDLGVVLESMPGEYSYPAIIADGNELLVTYTWNRKKIVFAKIKIS